MAIATGQISIVDFNDAPSLSAFISTTSPKTQIFDPATSTFAPNWSISLNNPVLTPSLFISSFGTSDRIADAKSVTWYDTSAPTTAISTGGSYEVTGSTLKITNNIMTGSTYAKTFICRIIWMDPATLADLVINAEFTFVRANNGQTGAAGANAISAILSNDSDVIPTDANGNNGIYTGAISKMTIYEGSSDVSSSWTVTATTSNVTGSLNSSTKTYTVSNMTADTGYVDLVASRSGYASITRRFALSKSKSGTAGSSPTLYRLHTNTDALQKTIANVFTPTTLIASAKYQVGEGAYSDYTGRFSYAISTNGTTFGTATNSSSDVASVTITPTSTTKAIKVGLYKSGTTSFVEGNLLDEQIINVVADGATGQDAVLASVSTPLGNLFKNDLIGSLEVQADVYKGASILTSGVVYEWFVQKSGAADAGAGAGWEKVTSANQASHGVTGSVTANKITVIADGVVNIAAFKVKATYASKAYYDTAIIYDQTDPIQVDVESSNGNIFKNGDVSTTLLCRLYQNGEEIDPKLASATTGYKYTYKWTKYKQNGTQDTAFGTSGIKTGKWIAVTPADVQQKAVFKVEIS